MKQFQLLREISCLEREENGLPWRKDNFIDRIKKLWRSCENWPSARRNAGNKIWESCDNNWVWNYIDKSFCSSVLPLFLSIVTAVLPCFSPLSTEQPIPKISQNYFISQCLPCVVLPLLVNTVWWSDKMSFSPFFIILASPSSLSLTEPGIITKMMLSSLLQALSETLSCSQETRAAFQDDAWGSRTQLLCWHWTT